MARCGSVQYFCPRGYGYSTIPKAWGVVCSRGLKPRPMHVRLTLVPRGLFVFHVACGLTNRGAMGQGNKLLEIGFVFAVVWLQFAKRTAEGL